MKSKISMATGMCANALHRTFWLSAFLFAWLSGHLHAQNTLYRAQSTGQLFDKDRAILHYFLTVDADLPPGHYTATTDGEGYNHQGININVNSDGSMNQGFIAKENMTWVASYDIGPLFIGAGGWVYMRDQVNLGGDGGAIDRNFTIFKDNLGNNVTGSVFVSGGTTVGWNYLGSLPFQTQADINATANVSITGCGEYACKTCAPKGDSKTGLGDVFTDVVDAAAAASASSAGGPSPAANSADSATNGTAPIPSVNVSVGLGRGLHGQGSASLVLMSNTASSALAGRQSLSLSGAVMEKLRDAKGLRQAWTQDALADIVTDTPYKYSISLYHFDDRGSKNGTTGLYEPTAAPYRKTVIENPNGAKHARVLKVTDFESGIETKSATYEWIPENNEWTLTDAGKRKASVTNATQDGNRVETRTISDLAVSGQPIISKIRCTYKKYTFGERLIEKVVDPDGAALTSKWDFYDNAGAKTGKVKWHTEPTGQWVAYDYDAYARETIRKSGLLNTALNPADPLGTDDSLCRVVTTTYGPYTRTSVAMMAGQEVARRYRTVLWAEDRSERTVTERECVKPGALAADPTNLVTTTVYHGLTGDYAWLPKKCTHPDGTLTLYTYSTATENGNPTRTTNIAHGKPNGGGTAVVEGSLVSTKVDHAGNRLLETVTDILSNKLVRSAETTSVDGFGRPTATLFEDGTTETDSEGCCGPTGVTDRYGRTMAFQYDAFGQVVSSTQDGMAVLLGYDAAGRLTHTWRRGTDSSVQLLQKNTFDLAGRVVESRDAMNRATTVAFAFDGNGRLVRTTTAPGGGTMIETFHRDGLPMSIGGTGAAPAQFEYGVEDITLPGEVVIHARFVKRIAVGDGGAVTEWTTTYYDMMSNVCRVVQSSGATTHYVYNSLGQLGKVVDPDGVTILYGYNLKGEREIEAVDVNGNNQVDYAGTDRIVQTVSSIATRGATTVERVETFLWNQDGVNSTITASSVDKTPNGLHVWSTSFGRLTEVTAAPVVGEPGKMEVTTLFPDGTSTVEVRLGQRPLTLEEKSSGGTVITGKSWTYSDPFLRLTTAHDNRSGNTTYAYFPDDQIRSVTLPPAAEGQASLVTGYLYDDAGRLSREIAPDGTAVQYEYWPTGAVKKVSGTRTYPAAYTYDAQGRVKTLTTWRDAGTGGGSAVTTWNYDGITGFLTSKLNANNVGPSYTYSPAGRMLTRTWVRGITTTYSRNSTGEVNGITYSDGTTPAVSHTFNRLGQVVATTDAAGTQTLAYANDGQITAHTYGAGMLNGSSLGWSYDAQGRLDGLTANAGGASDSIGYAYDTAGRMGTITAGDHSFVYGYTPNSHLVGAITSKRLTATVLTETRAHDLLGRLTSTGNILRSHAYSYDKASQVTKATREDASYWNYTYDDLGQLTSGKRHWDANTPVAGQQFSYQFDSIGNRQQAVVNGRTSSYTANSLNQYSARTVPGAVDIVGTANANATVTVNDGPTTRQGAYFHREVPVDNSSGPVAPAIAARGALLDPSVSMPNSSTPFLLSSRSGTTFVPAAAESYSYDADGNLTGDGRFDYVWDAENRLISITAKSAVPAAAKVKITCKYDAMHRRVEKQVWNWNDGTSQYVAGVVHRFLYDGWNLVAETEDGAVARRYTWGIDQSGTVGGAAGVGGLLALWDASTGKTHFPTYDGNGNVLALTQTDTSVTTAACDYAPFGEPITLTGPMAVVNPFRFSTHYTDDETGLVYAKHRYYQPSTGSWLGRDPLEEDGGLNLYGYVGNSPTNATDPLGMSFGSSAFGMVRAGLGIVGDAFSFGANPFAKAGWYHKCDPSLPRLLFFIATAAQGFTDFARAVADFVRDPAFLSSIVQGVKTGLIVGAAIVATVVTAGAFSPVAAAVLTQALMWAGGIGVAITAVNLYYDHSPAAVGSLVGNLLGGAIVGGVAVIARSVFGGRAAAAAEGWVAQEMQQQMQSAAKTAPELLLDTNVVIGQGKQFVASGQNIVKASISDVELSNLVRQGRISMPGAAKQIPSVPNSLNVDLRINLRGLLTPKLRGNFADGVIGATSIERGSTLITHDQALIDAVNALGGAARKP